MHTFARWMMLALTSSVLGPWSPFAQSSSIQASPKHEGVKASAPNLYPAQFFAVSACFIGDVDGDGCSDIAVGSPGEGDRSQGAVIILSGRNGRELSRFPGTKADEYLGMSLAALGDIDGDHVPDIAVASSQIDPGSVRVLSGANGNSLWISEGLSDERALGVRLAGLGDIDGDDVTDLIAACSKAGDADRAGNRYIALSGKTGKRIYSVDVPSTKNLLWDESQSFVSIGDWDNDGLSDFAAPSELGIEVYSAKNGAKIRTVPLPASLTKDHDTATGLCAWPSNDKNAPPAFVVGVPMNWRSESGPSTLITIRRGDEAKPKLVQGPRDDVGFGCCLIPWRDFDGDSIPELAVSSRSVLDSHVCIVSMVTGSVIRTIKPPVGLMSQFGRMLLTAGDLNGDGVADLVVVALSTDSFGMAGQGLYAYSGKSGSLLWSKTLGEHGDYR